MNLSKQLEKLLESIDVVIKNTAKTTVDCPTCKRSVLLFEHGKMKDDKEKTLIDIFSGICPVCGNNLLLFIRRNNESLCY